MEQEIKAGLEVHQQLDTGKLFCRCPSFLRNDSPLFRVERNLNPVAGETGEVDVAAAHEKSKEKTFIYEVYDTNCLVELDEEPPHELNKEALKIALQIALLMNCKIFPVSQVMRKTVINGSNTSGFQRTVLIAHDGWIETSAGKVGIETIALEEDAAREVGRKIEEDNDSEDNPDKDKVTYRLDRLGIPLVEITTKPDLKSPKQIKEAALKIGEILRACKVKRGIGTIRQDLNISIPEGNRVEIKGFQDPKIMIQTVEKEVQRQKELVLIHKAIKKAGKKFEEICDVSDIFRKSECRFIKNILDKGGKALACKFSGLSGFFGKELYDGRRFGSEVSDYARIFGVGGIIHSDENLAKYNFCEKEISELRKKLDIKKEDAFIIVAGDENQAGKAIEAAIFRIKIQADIAVPKEVRKSNPDASTSFLRPMPGASRMYPETDLELLKISKEMVGEVKKSLPKLSSELRGYLKNHGLNDELVKLVLEEGKVEEFKELMKIKENPSLIVKMLILFPREISVKGGDSERLNQDVLSAVLEEVDKKIAENEVKMVLQKIAAGLSLDDAIKKEKIDLKQEISALIKEKPGLSANAYMGLIMAKFKGKVSGKVVMDALVEAGIK